MIYTVTLNPALDYVMSADTLQYGTVNRATGEYMTFGGKGINVSAVLRELDHASVALGFVAGFTGNKLRELLQEQGITTDLCPTEGATRINVKIRADRELDINASGGIRVKEEHIQALLQKTDMLQDGDALVLAGAAPCGVGDDIYARILERVSDRDIFTAVDATGDLLKNALPFHPDIIKPNHQELGDLFGVTLENERGIMHYAARLKKMGAKNVLVSCAEHGAILMDEDACVHTVPAIWGEAVDSTGCGDSMLAGFMAEYLKTRDYDAALQWGNACGAACAFTMGLPKSAAITRLLRKQ